MRHALRITVVAILLLTLIIIGMDTLLSPPARAAGPWYVGPGGNDVNNCTSPATRCATINGALNKPGFVAGNIIRVAVGLYTGTGDEVVLLDKNATLSGGWDSNFTTQNGLSTVDGQGVRRGILVNEGVTTLIERFVVQKGFDTVSLAGGGGINNSGVLTLTHSTISSNTIGGGPFGTDGGGGIYNLGTSSLNYSAVNNNTSEASGGGIFNSIIGTLILNNSSANYNTVLAPVGIEAGGGGIYSDGPLTINNSTISGNTANHGGGIFRWSGNATLNNTTVSENRATELIDIYWDGGIYNGPYDTLTVKNSIIARNQGSRAPDCSGYKINSTGYNLIETLTGCTFTPTIGDKTGVPARLGPLEGVSGYHPLLDSSPAVNAGNPSGCTNHLGQLLTTDQRGQPRFSRCDMGAYEAQPIAFSHKTVTPATILPGGRVTFTLTLQNGGATPFTNVRVTDTLPSLLTYVNNSLSAPNGSYGYHNGVITWTGAVNTGASVNITFGATVSQTFGQIINTAVISGGGELITRTATLISDGVFCKVTKYGSNPVLSMGANGAWDDIEVWEPVVLKEGNNYKMWYFGFDGATSRIGYATSPDGLTWAKHPGNPVLSPTQPWEGSRVIAPTVIKDGGLYHMWYTGIDSNGASRIGYATSPDGITWTKHPGNPVLNIGPSGSWEDMDVISPAVLKLGNLYHMWYTGNDGSTRRIGHATSTNGVIWTKDAANPVFDIGPSGEWDWLHAYGPSVVYFNNTLIMWYSGYSLPAAWQTGYATSTDGSKWVRRQKLILPGASGAFDDAAADYSTVLVDGNVFKIWYSGFKEGGTYTIGYATAQVCEPVSPSANLVYLPLVMKKGGSAPCPAYYTDNFSDPGSGWPISDNNSRKFGYTGGEYQIWVKTPNTGWSVTPGAKATDFTASVSARRVSGNSGGYGIIFGINEDWSQWYEFDIGPQGYSIWQYLGNNSYNVLQNWTPSSHIKTGANWNRLKVIRSGANISVYVNNQHLATITNNDYTGLRRIGLTEFSGNSGIDARFDDFSLYPASCGVQAAGASFEMGKPEVYEMPALPGLE